MCAIPAGRNRVNRIYGYLIWIDHANLDHEFISDCSCLPNLCLQIHFYVTQNTKRKRKEKMNLNIDHQTSQLGSFPCDILALYHALVCQGDKLCDKLLLVFNAEEC